MGRAGLQKELTIDFKLRASSIQGKGVRAQLFYSGNPENLQN
jgi:hypothetical protein